jgi:hypothetical protein
MFNIYLIIYIVCCLALVAGGCSQFVKRDMMIGAGVFGIGAIIISILFGFKWFSSETSLLSQTPVKWPPVINTCPDYLSYYERDTITSKGGKEKTCIDRVGVSRNDVGMNHINLFPSDPSTPPTDNSYYFSLETTSNNPKKELCDRAKRFGLTWEGVTNGQSCIDVPSTSSTPSLDSGPATNCPPSTL